MDGMRDIRKEALIEIADGSTWEGKLPKRAARMVKKRALANQAQLMENWERCRRQQELNEIAGLE